MPDPGPGRGHSAAGEALSPCTEPSPHFGDAFLRRVGGEYVRLSFCAKSLNGRSDISFAGLSPSSSGTFSVSSRSWNTLAHSSAAFGKAWSMALSCAATSLASRSLLTRCAGFRFETKRSLSASSLIAARAIFPFFSACCGPMPAGGKQRRATSPRSRHWNPLPDCR